MKEEKAIDDMTGDDLLGALEALANPNRLRVVARLEDAGPCYVSQLARDLSISRPLLHMHLKRLEKAGLVSSRLDVSDEGKAQNWYSAVAFNLSATPQIIATASRTLSPPKPSRKTK